MRRRDFMTGLGVVVLASANSRAQQASPTIGFLSTRSPDEAAVHTNAFRRGLEEMGYVEGKNVIIEYRWAKGDYSQLPSFAADLLHRPLSLVVTPGDPAARAAKAAGFAVPIVFVVGEDPVRSGLVTSIEPSGNSHGRQLLHGRSGRQATGATLCDGTISAHHRATAQSALRGRRG
jgi:ABC-type uncharacterized transport system substrate-binding protein